MRNRCYYYVLARPFQNYRHTRYSLKITKTKISSRLSFKWGRLPSQSARACKYKVFSRPQYIEERCIRGDPVQNSELRGRRRIQRSSFNFSQKSSFNHRGRRSPQTSSFNLEYILIWSVVQFNKFEIARLRSCSIKCYFFVI